MHRRFEKPSTINGVSDETTSDPISDESDEREDRESGIQQQNGNRRTKKNGEGLAINETGYCALCGKASVCKCERCGDFYCSPQCQRKDWPNHRFICFPMPRLIKPGQASNTNEQLPILKADVVKTAEMTKEESRQAYKARQLSFIPPVMDLPPDGSTVVVTGFKSANRCYVRSADPSVTEEYQKILKKLDNFGKHSNDVTGVPKANTYAIAQRDDKWCRVQILSARPDNRIRVHFIDYGTVGVRYLRELRRISGAMSSLPCYIHMVQLHDVTIYSMQTKLLEQISQNVDKEFKIHFVPSDTLGGNIELYHMDTNKLLNVEILKMCQEFSEKETEHNSTTSNDNDVVDNEVGASPGKEKQTHSSPQRTTKKDAVQTENGTPGKKIESTPVKNNITVSPGSSGSVAKKKNLPPAPRQIPKPCLVPPFETITFDPNVKDVKMVVVDNSYVGRGYLGCLLEKDCDKLQAVQKFLQSYDGAGQPYKPKLEEYCIAEYESEWYRGKVVEILDEDKFLVAYIDFTNECELTSASIRRYPMSLNIPCCTNLCAIEGLPEDLDDKLIEYLEKTLCGFAKIHVNSIKMFDDVMFIECKELLKKLHDAKLI